MIKSEIKMLLLILTVLFVANFGRIISSYIQLDFLNSYINTQEQQILVFENP